MAYLLYDIVHHRPDIFSDTEVAPVMILITEEEAEAAGIDDKFLREPMGQSFQGSLAPWHYMLSVSELFDVDGPQKLTCVSKSIFEALWAKCPNKRHALYGGEAKNNKKEAKDLRPRGNTARAEVIEKAPTTTDDSLGGENYTEVVFEKRRESIKDLLLSVAAHEGITTGLWFLKYTSYELTDAQVRSYVTNTPGVKLTVNYGRDPAGTYVTRYATTYSDIKAKLDLAFIGDPDCFDIYTDLDGVEFPWTYDAERKVYTRVETDWDRKYAQQFTKKET